MSIIIEGPLKWYLLLTSYIVGAGKGNLSKTQVLSSQSYNMVRETDADTGVLQCNERT